MDTYHVRVYVGPSLVEDLARKFKEADIEVTFEGTSHVYCLIDSGSGYGEVATTLLKRLTDKHGHKFCLLPADVQVLRKMPM